jgi:hypothetical protein
LRENGVTGENAARIGQGIQVLSPIRYKHIALQQRKFSLRSPHGAAFAPQAQRSWGVPLISRPLGAGTRKRWFSVSFEVVEGAGEGVK